MPLSALEKAVPAAIWDGEEPIDPRMLLMDTSGDATEATSAHCLRM
jgi:hypothetical protein